MATVLLIITIPTEIEELRRRQEFVSRKQDGDDNFDTSNGLPSQRSKCEDSSEDIAAKPHIHEAVKRAMLLFKSSQQRNLSSLYPKASEIFDTKPNSSKESNFPTDNVDQDDQIVDISPDVVESKTVDFEIIDTMSKKTPTPREYCDEIMNSDIYRSTKKSSNCLDGDMYKDVCMETVMRIVLKELAITNSLWTQDNDNRMYQIMFTVSFDEAYEELLHELHEWGIGDRAGSTVSVLNCIVSKKAIHESETELRFEDPQDNGDVPSTTSNGNSRIRTRNRSQTRYRKGIWERFMNTVRSRLNIVQIVHDVRQDAVIDFDFMILLISAALLSAFGLIEDSIVFLASSMLISPLMGPIIAAIFGTVIKDTALRNIGIRNECFGILVSLVVGFCFGILVCVLDTRFQSMEDITNEMIYRGEMHTLLMSSIAAIPSGAAVAIGILNGNMGSLIGVAISASLLPPAVNSGMLWAMALFYLVGDIDQRGYGIHEKFYSENIVWNFIVMSGVSMGITVLNIVLVFITGVVLLKVKEVVPGIGGSNREFWKRDIKIARDLSQHEMSANAAIIEEFSNLPSEDQKAMGIDSDMLRSMQTSDANCQRTWSPGLRFDTGTAQHDNYATVHRLEYLYSTITRQGYIDQLSVEPGPSGKQMSSCGLRHGERSYNYYLCNERQRKHATTDAGQYKNVSNTDSSTEMAQTIAGVNNENDNQSGKVRRFVITPVEKVEEDGDEFDV